MDYSLPDSPVWILQASKLEWLPFPSPGDLSNPGVKPGSPALQTDSLLSEPPEKPISYEAHLFLAEYPRAEGRHCVLCWALYSSEQEIKPLYSAKKRSDRDVGMICMKHLTLGEIRILD